MKRLSVIIPTYNEELVVKECYQRINAVMEKLNKYDNEIIFVDDGSNDSTLELLEQIAQTKNNCKIISFSRNFGQQAAIQAGLEYSQGDAAVIIDADLQDPPELIIDMVQLWEEGNDVIYAKKTKRDGESIFKKFTAKAFYVVLNSLSETDISRDVGDFRLIDRKVIDTINSFPEHNKFYRGLFNWVGFKQKPIEYHRKKRFQGKSKYSFSKMSKLASDGIIGLSIKPLKLIGKIGFLLFIISILLLIVLSSNNNAVDFKEYLLNNYPLICLIIFIAGIQLLTIGVIGEYIKRIYDESLNRPEYIIAKTINI